MVPKNGARRAVFTDNPLTMPSETLNSRRQARFSSPPAQPFFKARSPDNRWSVTVEVEQEDGRDWFSCFLTLDDETVLESIVTDSQEKMLKWVRRQMESAMRRCVHA